jgi:hypothetical protein
LLDDGLLDAPCGFVLFAVFADAVRDYCFAAVLVLGDLVWGERGGGLLVVFFRPVGAATRVSTDGFLDVGLCELTLQLVTFSNVGGLFCLFAWSRCRV